jgi:hypothetical protein
VTRDESVLGVWPEARSLARPLKYVTRRNVQDAKDDSISKKKKGNEKKDHMRMIEAYAID